MSVQDMSNRFHTRAFLQQEFLLTSTRFESWIRLNKRDKRGLDSAGVELQLMGDTAWKGILAIRHPEASKIWSSLVAKSFTNGLRMLGKLGTSWSEW